MEYIRSGRKRRILASKEVILSAGAINSPHLLMLSGIGNAQHLQEKGIDVIHDSPGVGELILLNFDSYNEILLFLRSKSPRPHC